MDKPVVTYPHQHKPSTSLNQLRAAVLGANDGIVSVAGVVFGVAGATSSSLTILTAGIAAVVAGALSMAVGEYVSVSSQRDSEKATLDQELLEITHYPKEELQELINLYQDKGLSPDTAKQVAKELTAYDAFKAHLDAELGLDPNNLTSAWQAAIASALAFLAGAIIPLLAITLPPADIRVPLAFVAVVFALAATGFIGAKVGGANTMRASLRVVIGGVLAMAITYGIGTLLGTALA